jgi:hypothetical protein
VSSSVTLIGRDAHTPAAKLMISTTDDRHRSPTCPRWTGQQNSALRTGHCFSSTALDGEIGLVLEKVLFRGMGQTVVIRVWPVFEDHFYSKTIVFPD